MNVIVDTIAKVAGLQPPSLPQLSLVNVPDISAVSPLASIAGTDPSKMLSAAGVLEKDQDTIRRIAGEASGLSGACAQGLVALAMDLASRSVPLAVRLLIPHTTARLSANAALKTYAM